MSFLEFLGSEDWLSHCRSADAQDAKLQAHGLPSGVTYLSQLMGHDMFLTEPRKDTFIPNYKKHSDRTSVNMVERKLVLETVYGSGGSGDRRLYQESNRNKFDLLPHTFQQQTVFSLKFLRDPRRKWSYPNLADNRNFSSPILSHMVLAFMIYHNHLIDWIAAHGTNEQQKNPFSVARAIVILTWHKIIRNDVLEKCAMPKERAEEALGRPQGPEWEALVKKLLEDEETLARDVLRSFHSLPKSSYKFNRDSFDFRIANVLKKKNRGPEIPGGFSNDLTEEQSKNLVLWQRQWQPDWTFFFDAVPGEHTAKNRTGFTPSFSFMHTDGHEKQQIQTVDAKREKLEEYRGLVAQFGIRETVMQFWKDVTEVKGSEPDISPLDLPWSVLALVEAQYAPGKAPEDFGKLGPLGSIALRLQMNKILRAADSLMRRILSADGLTQAVRGGHAPDIPSTFMEMIESMKHPTSRWN
ncbi:hypothetical protein [Cognatiyoonia sp. IB215182]|uniref:hypothetical protein n=1 Tax=Cognatiyoonia sp. IB215182 TaxID=3097353 RepID=UPI002A12FCD5|nr:hypothetical protein [Cognatiyoonia sp. IB215182]MDX8355318.1 hypothetical protein [Cognatiyoonia sp. IB215182]